jgi:hypothetical protein
MRLMCAWPIRPAPTTAMRAGVVMILSWHSGVQVRRGGCGIRGNGQAKDRSVGGAVALPGRKYARENSLPEQGSRRYATCPASPQPGASKMVRSIATVSIGGTLDEKLRTIAAGRRHPEVAVTA